MLFPSVYTASVKCLLFQVRTILNLGRVQSLIHCGPVKTLAIRSTAEEFMVKRRDDLKRGRGSGSGRLINLVDDVSMRNFIAVSSEVGPPDRKRWLI